MKFERNQLLDMLTAWADTIGVGFEYRCKTAVVKKAENLRCVRQS
jgi:hypothetical protein